MTDRTIDELARDAGTPTSTVRMYQSKGLLPPPRLVGRVGIYDDAHLARLHLIGRLQERGFSLAAIRHLVDAWSSGRGLPEVLGLADPDGRSVALELTPSQLAETFTGVALTEEAMAKAVALGLVELDGSVVRVPHPEYLRLGSEIARLGIPAEEVLDEFERLRATLGATADRFVTLFDRHVLGTVEGLDAERVAAVAATFDRLRALASAVVDEVLREQLAVRAERRLTEEADRVATSASTSASSGITTPKPRTRRSRPR